jgi:single-strand DNA-binding protein
VAESFTRGMRVIVAGRLQQRSCETKDGDKRSGYELQVDEAGPSLRNATAKVTKASCGQAWHRRHGAVGGRSAER